MSQDIQHTEGESSNMVKTIWRTFWIMLVVTIIEVTAARLYPTDMPRLVVNIFFIVMSGVKAFYIVAVFMHLKFEIKYLIITVLLPTIFLMYTLIIMLTEGNSWLNMQHAGK